MVPPFDQAQQILAKHLEHHADVDAVGTFVLEGIQQADDMFLAGMVGVGLDDLLQQLNLIDGGLGVMGGGTDDFEGDMPSGDGVSGQPDGGEVTPTQLADDDVFALLEGFAGGDGMVATFAVVLGVLLFGGDLGGVVLGRGGGGRSALLCFLVGQGGIGTVGAAGTEVKRGPVRGGGRGMDVPGTVHLEGAVGTGAGTLLVVGGDDGLQILTLPPLLSGGTIGRIICGSRDLLCFVDGGLFYVISIHDTHSKGGRILER